MDDPVRTALLVVVLPAVVAAVVFLALRALRRGKQDAAAVGAAIAAGFVAGFIGAAGAPKFPPTDAWQWIPAVAVLAAAVGLAERGAAWIRWTLRVGVAAFAAWVTDVDHAAIRLAAMVAGTVVVIAGLDGVGRRAGPRTLLAAVVVVATATSVALVVSGTARLGTACGALTAATAACLVLAARFPVSAAGVAVVAGASLAAFWMNGVLFAETPLASVLLLASAPFAAWTPIPAADARPLRAALARTGLVAAVAGAAVAYAVVTAPPLEY